MTQQTTDPKEYFICTLTRSMTTSNRMHISEFFEYEQEDMGEPEKEDSLDEMLQEKTPEEAKQPAPYPLIEGPESLQCALKILVEKYIGLLQAEVSVEPARVQPFKLNVDEKRWTLPGAKNTQRYRTQSAVFTRKTRQRS